MLLGDKLKTNGIIRSIKLVSAFNSVLREDFLRMDERELSQADAPLPIGCGQTNSQPTTVALMLEMLAPRSGQNILDVGCGSGWTTALLAHAVGSGGRVYGLEIIPELKNFAEANILKYDFIQKGIVKIFQGSGYQGLKDYAPFDRILVSAAAEAIPQELLWQLGANGRMVIPIGGREAVQDLVVVEKNINGRYKESRYHGFVFVPLVE